MVRTGAPSDDVHRRVWGKLAPSWTICTRREGSSTIAIWLINRCWYHSRLRMTHPGGSFEALWEPCHVDTELSPQRTGSDRRSPDRLIDPAGSGYVFARYHVISGRAYHSLKSSLFYSILSIWRFLSLSVCSVLIRFLREQFSKVVTTSPTVRHFVDGHVIVAVIMQAKQSNVSTSGRRYHTSSMEHLSQNPWPMHTSSEYNQGVTQTLAWLKQFGTASKHNSWTSSY